MKRRPHGRESRRLEILGLGEKLPGKEVRARIIRSHILFKMILFLL